MTTVVSKYLRRVWKFSTSGPFDPSERIGTPNTTHPDPMKFFAIFPSETRGGIIGNAVRLFSHRLLLATVSGLAAAVCSIAADAQPISGTIDFTGGAVLNGSLETATTFTSYFGNGVSMPTVLGGSQTGDYQFVPAGTQVMIDPFSLNPSSVPPIPLWSFSVNSTHYSFTATSILVVNQSANFLNVEGTGVASITGFADTPATWSFTDTGSGAGPSFNFGGSIAVVPEPSITPLIMALPLLGFMLFDIRRKFRLAADVSLRSVLNQA
jgi:hypothetical protein